MNAESHEPEFFQAGRLPNLGKGPPLFVLHIDDDANDCLLFQLAAQKATLPFWWQTVSSPSQGIAYLKRLLAQSYRVPVTWPDLIITDLIMPEGSGLHVLQFLQITPQLAAIKCVILTGSIDPYFAVQARNLGVSAYLEKPHSPDQTKLLMGRLWALCRKASNLD